jgi:hypothetical protein
MDKIYKKAQRRAGMTVAQMPLVIIIAAIISFALLLVLNQLFEMGIENPFLKVLLVIGVFLICEIIAFLVGWCADPAYLFMVNSHCLHKTKSTIEYLKSKPVHPESPLYDQYEALLKKYELKHADLAAEKGRLTMFTKFNA